MSDFYLVFSLRHLSISRHVFKDSCGLFNTVFFTVESQTLASSLLLVLFKPCPASSAESGQLMDLKTTGDSCRTEYLEAQRMQRRQELGGKSAGAYNGGFWRCLLLFS